MKSAAILVIALLAFTAPIAAEETATVGEAFLCTFHEGKGWDDLGIAIDVYNDAVARSGIQTPANEFIWRPLRSQVEFDFLWAAYTENMSAWGRNMAAYLESEGGSLADAVFDSVIECESAMAFVELIYDSDGHQQASRDSRNPNALESYACSLNEGKTWADLMAATELWHGYVTKLGIPMDTYRRTPLIGNTPEIDVLYFAVHPNLQSFADSTTKYQTGAGMAEVEEALAAVQTCRSSLWTSWQVSPRAD